DRARVASTGRLRRCARTHLPMVSATRSRGSSARMTSVASAQEAIREHLKRTAETTLLTADACAADIERAAIMIADAFKAGGKLLICGNGGSAADSQHMAAELVSRLTLDFERPGLPAIALTTDTSVL